MCGLAGVAGAPDRSRAKAAVRRMCHDLRRRGPDAEGLQAWDGAVLGHRRLSIFDLSDAGSQPMTSPDGQVGVVFNGAIYNFPELRERLRERGYAFASRTDTEVLVHGYRAWGIDGLVERLRGMFAFGLWDAGRETLYLVRDRLGVKPLCYSIEAGALTFASTVRALHAGGAAAGLDETAVAEFLEYGYVTEDRCIHRGARKLPPASILEWRRGRATTRRYWSIPRPRAAADASFERAVEEAEERIRDAVQVRLDADVPVGALLSGGIDSALVCWGIAEAGADLTAFTVGTPGDPWDETDDAAETARALGLRHQVVELSAEEEPRIDELVSAYGEPFACASALGMLRVSRAVAGSAKVLLTGDGGDDVFLGYNRHRYLWLAERLARRIPPAVGGAWRSISAGLPRPGALGKAVRFLDCATGGLGAYLDAYEGLPDYRADGLLGRRLADAVIRYRDLPRSVEGARGLFWDYFDYHQETQFVAEYLTKVDGATMHHGIEARSPFLDQEVWAFASSLPVATRLRRARPKAVLRELARRRIGPFVADRTKRGFGIPVQRWLAGRWRSSAEAAFTDSILERERFLDGGRARELLEAAADRGRAPMQLWYLYVLECWMRAEASGQERRSARVRATV